MQSLPRNKFYPGMPIVTYDDPEYSQKYWRGNTWLNVAYFAAKGLKNHGFKEIADGIKLCPIVKYDKVPEAAISKSKSKYKREVHR